MVEDDDGGGGVSRRCANPGNGTPMVMVMPWWLVPIIAKIIAGRAFEDN